MVEAAGVKVGIIGLITANALPSGLIDHIIAGHAHSGMAHVVNGIAVTSAFSNTYASGRTPL
jgi:2',3'-cyclic-nucleotide 2'-phosphodiesterase (5'-nucleotidase family)